MIGYHEGGNRVNKVKNHCGRENYFMIHAYSKILALLQAG